jgi:hypothetical protein
VHIDSKHVKIDVTIEFINSMVIKTTKGVVYHTYCSAQGEPSLMNCKFLRNDGHHYDLVFEEESSSCHFCINFWIGFHATVNIWSIREHPTTNDKHVGLLSLTKRKKPIHKRKRATHHAV